MSSRIVKVYRKVRFSKRQIDRMVTNLRVYLNEVEQSEETVRRCKTETGLSLAQLKEAWGKMHKSIHMIDKIHKVIRTARFLTHATAVYSETTS